MCAAQNPNTPAPVPAASAGFDLAGMINQMRLQVVGVGLAFLILSLAFDFYVYRHNSKLSMQRNALNQQLQTLQDGEKRFLPAINDLAGYTVQRPQLRVLFERSGLQLAAGTNQPGQPPKR